MGWPELVSPAGNLEKGLTALHFGADAVYTGLRCFNLREASDNLDPDELAVLVRTARRLGRRVYLTANIFPRDEDWAELPAVLETAGQAAVDAIIVSDPGVLREVRRRLPGMPVHLSTQANVLNGQAARFWLDQGIRRIILARELSLRQVERIVRANPDGQFEIFAHGAVCMAYSGRCFISRYLTGADANRGACKHPCRWTYRVEEASRPDEFFPVTEGSGFSQFYYSRDLLTVDLLPALTATGVRALKIEGRMRSVFYTALATLVYRQALDRLAEDAATFPAAVPDWLALLQQIPNRGYSHLFYTGGESPETLPDVLAGIPREAAAGEKLFLGTLGETVDGLTELRVKNPFRRDEPLAVLTPRGLAPVSMSGLWNHRQEPAAKADSGLTMQAALDRPVTREDILCRPGLLMPGASGIPPR